MKFKTRTGIVMTSVGGQKILVAANALHDQIPYVSNINDTTAFCWELLIDGISEEELAMRVIEQFEIEDSDVVKKDIASLIKHLYEKGYIERLNHE